MSNISRRNFFKFLTLSAGATMVANASDKSNGSSVITAQKTQLLAKNKKQTRVVVVGGGIAGLSVAEEIKRNDPDNKIEVVVLERNAQYFACPMSNTLFAELKEVEDAKIPFKYDYTLAEKNYNLDVIITEVIDADIKRKLLLLLLERLIMTMWLWLQGLTITIRNFSQNGQKRRYAVQPKRHQLPCFQTQVKRSIFF